MKAAPARGRGSAIARAVAGIACLLWLLAWSFPAAAFDLRGIGVVFLHGKGVWPGAFDGGIPSALEAEGAFVEAPEMPWSIRRMYGATFDDAMREIDAAVARLKAKGATKIVVIGHSLGANGAIGYAARRSGIAAVVALAPGHLPETPEMRSRTADAIEEARRLVAAGDTSRHAWPDMIQGVPTFANASPAVYLSMFDPVGPAVIPKNVAALRGVPLLWVVGRFDPVHSRGPEYAFSTAAKNPKNSYVEVFASHLTTPRMAQGDVIAWLKSL